MKDNKITFIINILILFSFQHTKKLLTSTTFKFLKIQYYLVILLVVYGLIHY